MEFIVLQNNLDKCFVTQKDKSVWESQVLFNYILDRRKKRPYASGVISFEEKMITLSCVIMMMNKRQEEGEW